MITVLCGGVGAARFLRGLVEVVPPQDITAIVNTADDFVLHGLYICPDLDTVRSTLAGDIGPQGWGRAGESWVAMGELRELAKQAPSPTRASDWFSLGDRDLAVHLYRTQRRAEGASLQEVTDELRRYSGVEVKLLPMCEEKVSTRLVLDSGEDIDFQDYFVARRHSVAVRQVRVDGIDSSAPTQGVLDALARADRVIIAPSNPFLSIGPILAVPGLREALVERRSAVTAISPIVGGRALKGPADRLFTELIGEPSVTTVAQLWRDVASRLVIDDADELLSDSVHSLGMGVVVTSTVMDDTATAAALARRLVTDER